MSLKNINKNNQIKNYIFKGEEIEKIKKFCKMQFSIMNTNRDINSLNFTFSKISKFFSACISPNYNYATYNGIIYPAFTIKCKYIFKYFKGYKKTYVCK